MQVARAATGAVVALTVVVAACGQPGPQQQTDVDGQDAVGRTEVVADVDEDAAAPAPDDGPGAEPETDPAPTAAAPVQRRELDGVPVTLELVGCENRVPSGSDRIRPVAVVVMTNTGGERLGVRISGASQLDGRAEDGGWYGVQMSGGRELDAGEVYTMTIGPDLRHQSVYAPGSHLACRVHDVRVWQPAGDLDVNLDPMLERVSDGDVDVAITDEVDRDVPTDTCVELDGLPGYREQTVLRRFLTVDQCEASLG